MSATTTLVIISLVLLCTSSISHSQIAGSTCLTGCRDATREGLNQFSNVALCSGSFQGYVAGKSAQALCADGWHVCTQTRDRDLLANITYNVAIGESGCYALDAAHDFDTCRPCTGNINEDDMAGIGGNCPNKQAGLGSCFSGGRVDICCSGYLESNGCMMVAGVTTGVACCADNPVNPCFNGTCPKNCCGHGTCDRAFGTCNCNPGFSGEDCCTQCSAITDCNACMAQPTCGWCNGSSSCTERLFPSCFDITFDLKACPVPVQPTKKVNPTAIIAGSAAGGGFGLIAASALLGYLLYRKFSKGEYVEFWQSVKMSGANTNPLYDGNGIGGSSPFYQEPQ